MVYFDSHCHLNDEAFANNLDEEISHCLEAGVKTMVCIGYDIESSKRAIEIASKYEGIYAAIGVHPENRDGLVLGDLSKIRELAKHPKVIAIGEIGLDYHWYKTSEEREPQKPWFIAQIELANELGLPVSIHARDAAQDTYEILKAHPVHAGAVLHCYSGSPEMLPEFAKLGLYFGFDGPITYKNAIAPKECVRVCPEDRILSETDSPYLSPVPFRGTQNSPSRIPVIVAAMAELRGISVEMMCDILNRNFERLFRVKP